MPCRSSVLLPAFLPRNCPAPPGVRAGESLGQICPPGAGTPALPAGQGEAQSRQSARLPVVPVQRDVQGSQCAGGLGMHEILSVSFLPWPCCLRSNDVIKYESSSPVRGCEVPPWNPPLSEVAGRSNGSNSSESLCDNIIKSSPSISDSEGNAIKPSDCFPRVLVN